jgi:hypothetical protein
MATTREVAEWMVRQLNAGLRLYQDRAVRYIRANFGEEFSYRNENRNWAISPGVLADFDALAPATGVKWAVHGRYWRKAREGDPAGRSVRR